MAPPARWNDAATTDEIIAAVEEGQSLATACRRAGLNPRLWQRWRTRVDEWREQGSPDGGIDVTLLAVVERVEHARAVIESRVVMDLIRSDSDGKGWQRLAFWLERRNPQDWAPPKDGAAPAAAPGPRHDALKPEDIASALALVASAEDAEPEDVHA